MARIDSFGRFSRKKFLSCERMKADISRLPFQMRSTKCPGVILSGRQSYKGGTSG